MGIKTSILLAEISASIGILPILIGLFRRKQANAAQRTLLLLVLFAFATEIVALAIAGLFKANNLFLSHFFPLIEFFFLSKIYQKELEDILPANFFTSLLIVFTSGALINSFFFESLLQFNNKSRAISSLLIIFFTLAYFYKTLKEVKIKKLESEPLFWLSIGLLIYFSASFFIFIFSNYLQPSVKLSYTFWGIHALLNISLYLFYAIALWIKPQKTV